MLNTFCPMSKYDPYDPCNVTVQGGGTDRMLVIGTAGINAYNAHGYFIGSTTAGQKVDVRLYGSQTWRAGSSGGSQLAVRNTLSREASDTVNRTLLLDVGDTFQPAINLQGNISDGGASGTLAIWLTGFSFHTWTGVNTHTGGTIINGGRPSFTTTSFPTSGPLILRGTRWRDGTTGGLYLSSAASTYNHGDIRIESGVTTLSMPTDVTFNMGTITRNGGVLRLSQLAGQTFNVNNANVNGILGPWAVIGDSYVQVSGGALATHTSTAAGADAMTDPTANYTVSGGTLTADRFANTARNGFGQTINLGSSGDHDLTINGVLATSGGWSITRSGTSTGKLIIGDTEELVVAGAAGFSASVPIVDGSGGPGRLTLAPMGGIITLSGDNTYSGGTVFSPAAEDPRILINSATALGTGAFYIYNNTGGSTASRVLTRIDNSTGADITLANNNAQFWNGDFRFIGTRSLNMGTGNVSLGEVPALFATRTVEVTANTLTIGGAISDGTHADYPVNGLTKTGAGTLELTGVSTYSGATTVSAGTLALGASASLASTAITVASGTTLQLTGSASLADSATLTLNGVANPAGGVKERVGALYLGGVAQAQKKTYGSTASAAMVTSDTYFTPGSTGVIEVGVVPAGGTAILVR